jgi:hypothetical protein
MEPVKDPADIVKTMEIKDQVDALNGMVLLVNIAYKRGAYALMEAAKVWEALTLFTPK